MSGQSRNNRRRKTKKPEQMWASIGRRKLKNVISGDIKNFRDANPESMSDNMAVGLSSRIRKSLYEVLYIYEDGRND